MLSRLLLAALLLALCAVAVADNFGAMCTNAQLNMIGQQDGGCDIDSPFCVYTTASFKQCARCPVVTGQQSSYGGVAACNCDPTLYYCGQANSGSGACLAYTMLDNPCNNDAQCQRSVTRRLQSGTDITVLEEQLFCVAGKCKPCDPVAWAANVGPLGVATVRCAGFSPSISDAIGRYATATRLSGASYTCLATGDFQWVDPAVDYNYQYPCDDRSLWPTGCSGTGGDTTATTLTTDTTATPDSGAAAHDAFAALAVMACVLVASLLLACLDD